MARYACRGGDQMALLAFDGFDNYAANGSDLLDRRGGGLQWAALYGATTASPGRVGVGSYMAVDRASYLRGTLTMQVPSGYIGAAIRVLNFAQPNNPSITMVDRLSNQPQVLFVLNVERQAVDIYRGVIGGPSVLIGASPNNSLTLAAWNYVEFFATISQSAGVVMIRSNGQTIYSASGLNTQNTTNAYFDGFDLNGPPAPTDSVMHVDDLYVCDSTLGPGPYPFNNFVGDVRVATLNPIGAGGTTQWTPLANTNWQEVSEVANDHDASYNYTTTVGAEDLFNFADLPATISQILAVQITGSYRKDDAGTHLLTQQILSGATAAAGAAYSIPLDYVYLNDFWVTDPNTSGGWTIAAVNALQAGYTLTS